MSELTTQKRDIINLLMELSEKDLDYDPKLAHDFAKRFPELKAKADYYGCWGSRHENEDFEMSLLGHGLFVMNVEVRFPFEGKIHPPLPPLFKGEKIKGTIQDLFGISDFEGLIGETFDACHGADLGRWYKTVDFEKVYRPESAILAGHSQKIGYSGYVNQLYQKENENLLYTGFWNIDGQERVGKFILSKVEGK
jgi:hypothetical protein